MCGMCLVGRWQWIVKQILEYFRFSMVFILEFFNGKYACVGAILGLV